MQAARITVLLCIIGYIHLRGVNGCEDRQATCRRMVSNGECIRNPLYMIGNCKKSCGWCPKVVICEGGDKLISCSSSVKAIKISNAFFGRREKDICPHELADRTNCSAPDVTERLRKVCEGRQYCHLTLRPEMAAQTFGEDPCPGTYKYMQVEYTCEDCEDRFTSQYCERERRSSLMECTRPQSWIRDYCLKTCSGCHHSECTNPYGDMEWCDYWALTDECTQNAKWMSDQCQMSCRVCKESERDIAPIQPRRVKQELMCEGETTTLSCGSPDKAIKIVSAFYGRADKMTCPHELVADWTEICQGGEAIERLREVCDGRMFCHVGVFDNLGTDPCIGIYKYLRLEYVCEDCANSPEMEGPSDDCTKLKTEGYCSIMGDKYCYRTCSKCDESECINEHGDDKSCDYWAMRGECYHNPGWMKRNCAMSCRTCNGTDTLPPPIPQGECVNKHMSGEQCTGWALRGECIKNRPFMLDSCYQACSGCQKSDVIKTLVCEGEDLVLKCMGGKRVRVQEAKFGRTDNNLCPHEKMVNTNCVDPDVVDKVKEECEGASECNLPVYTDVFGDPCPGTYKYITVTYNCTA